MATTRIRPMERSRSRATQDPSPHFVVCGQDELGYRAAEELNRLGEQVVFITGAAAGERLLASLAELGISVVRGSYREDRVLLEAGIGTARALIIAESDDIGNLHAALAAHELNPQLRVVLRIFNGELGRRVQDLLHDCEVLSSSTIAAPGFVAAALQSEFQQSIQAEGKLLVVRHGRASDPGVLMVLASEDESGAMTLFPEAGESVLCLADGNAVAPSNSRAQPARPRRRRLPPGLLATGHLISSLADNRVRYLLGFVAALVLVSMLVFHFFAGLSLLDAVYFTTTTITTIGYGDISMLRAGDGLKIFNIALELTGAASMAIFFAVITDTLVGARLREALGGIRHELSDHVVVCGVGNIGHRVVEQVHAMGLAVVAMDVTETAKAIPELRRQGIPIVIGDAGELPNLEALCLETARCLVVTTDDDMTNLEVALAARSINPELRIVVQLHDPDLAAKIQRAIGVGVSRSSAGLAAPAFVSSALGHRILGSIPVGERMLVVAHAALVEGAEAAGRQVDWLQHGLYGRVLMLRRSSQQTWCPGPETRLDSGDEVLLVTTRKALDGFLKRLEAVAVPA